MGSSSGKTINSFKWEDKFEIIERNSIESSLTLMERETEEEYIGREIVTSDENDRKELENLISTKFAYQSPYVIKLDSSATKNDDGYCSDTKVYYILFKKPYQTLKEQTLNRKFKSQTFSEQQILLIVEAGVKALKYLQQINHPHQNVSSSSIFIKEDRKIIVGDPWMSSNSSKTNLNLNVNGYTYPSPQKILYQNDLIEQYDLHLSDLYSLGVVMLQVIFMEHMDVIYDKGYRRVLESKVIERINKISNQRLKQLIKILLSHEPYKRKEIFKMYNIKQNPKTAFIKNQRNKFKQAFIQKNLQVSHVKQWDEKKSKANHPTGRQSFINRINQSKDPQQQNWNIDNKFKDMKSTIKPSISQADHLPRYGSLNHYQPPKIVVPHGQHKIQFARDPMSAFNPPPTQKYYVAEQIILPKLVYSPADYAKPAIAQLKTQQFSKNTQFNPIRPVQHDFKAYVPLDMSKTTTYNEPSKALFKPFEQIQLKNQQNMEQTKKESLPYYEFSGLAQKTPSKQSLMKDNVLSSVNHPIRYAESQTKLKDNNTQIFNNFATNENFNNENIQNLTKQTQQKKEFSKSSEQNVINSFHLEKKSIENVAKLTDSHLSKEVMNHAQNEKHSASYGVNFKRQPEARSSLPSNCSKDSYDSQSDYIATRAVSDSSDKAILQTINNQSQLRYENAQRPQTPERRPKKNKYNSTIKQVSQGSPSGESYDFDLQEKSIEYDIGTRYVGQTKNGKRHGKGTFYYQDGSYYTGHWKDNKMHGKGNLYYSNGKTAYEGSWYLDDFHGHGKIYNDEPLPLDHSFDYRDFGKIDDHWEFYDGDLCSDRKNGQGKLKLSNGQIYIGRFQEDKIHGEGKFYRLNGGIVQGKWNNNVLVEQFSK